MNRRTAKVIHETTNMTYWIENPDWDSGSAAFNLVCRAFRVLPFSVHEAQKRMFFDTRKLVAVNGETVVAANGADKVDKFMFRYPGKMTLAAFGVCVGEEVAAVTSSLDEIALPTSVGIKSVDIFRRPQDYLHAVVQTQDRIDLDVHAPMSLPALLDETVSPILDKTARDIELMLDGTERLATDYGFYPDIAHSSGNLRRNIHTGDVTLIDVMPIYKDGGRLIGDNIPNLAAHMLENIQAYQDFVGQYGG